MQSMGGMSAAAHNHSYHRGTLVRPSRQQTLFRALRNPARWRHAVQRPKSAPTSSRSDELVKWMQQEGASISGVHLVYETQQHGSLSRELRATRDLSAGDVVLSVPLACCIYYIDNQQHAQNTTSSSSSSSIAALRRLQNTVPTASGSARGAWQFKVALEILYHYYQGSSSPLYPYIQTLPGVYPGIAAPQVAMLYPQQQLQELQYPPLIGDAANQQYWLQQYSSDVLARLPGSANDPFGGKLVPQAKLGWALSVAMSRAFGFKQGGGWALVPLLDMANHALISNAEIRFDANSSTVRMLANKQITAGSPILLKYGPHDSSNLLLSYGFLLPDNPADRYTCELDMDLLLSAVYQFVGGELPPSGRATDGLKQWQRRTLQLLGLLSSNSSSTSSGTTAAQRAAAGDDVPAAAGSSAKQQPVVLVQIGGDPPVSPALLAAVRVSLATDGAPVKGKTLEQLGDWHQPLSTAHEAVVMKALVGFVTVLYKSFPTSIQADRALLAELQQRHAAASAEAARAAAAAAVEAAGVAADSTDSMLSVERLRTAVQFRLGLKLLLEQSTKALIVRLKQLLQ